MRFFVRKPHVLKINRSSQAAGIEVRFCILVLFLRFVQELVDPFRTDNALLQGIDPG